MIEMKVAVSISFTGQLQGALQREDAVISLAPSVQPDSTVKVLLPVLVNHKAIDAQTPLRFYEAKVEKEDKRKNEVTPIDNLAEWTKQRRIEDPTGSKGRGRKGR